MTEEVKKMLPLNIQIFADDPEAEKEKDTKATNDKSGDDKADEGDKKAQETAKKYTDDDVNNISVKNERKAVRDVLKKLGYKVSINATKEEMDAIIEEATNKKEEKSKDEDNSDKGNSTEDKVATLEKQNKYINAELKLALFQANIKKEKIGRAINLIDKSKILDDGEIDPDKLAEEIESLTKEWSELLDNKKEDDSSVGFVVGSDGKQEKGTDCANLSEIFGNKL